MSNIDKILNQVREQEENRKEVDDELDLLRDSFDQWILVE